MKYFTKNYEKLEDIKKHYRELCKKLHSDFGGSDADFIAMKKEYDYLLKNFIETQNFGNNEDFEIIEELKEKLKHIIYITDITIEVIGTWLWVSGNTITHKEMLKKLGFLYSSNKKMWFYTKNLRYKNRKGKSKYNMQDLQSIYKHRKIEKETQYKLS